MTHTVLVEERLESLISSMKDAETGVRGYVATRDTVFLQPYTNAYNRTIGIFNQIKYLTADNKAQQISLVMLRKQIDSRFNTLKMVMQNLNNPSPFMKMGKKQMDQTRSLVVKMQLREKKLLAVRADAEFWDLIYTSVSVLLIIAIALVIIYRFYRKLISGITRIRQLKIELYREHKKIKQRVKTIQRVTREISEGKYNLLLDEADEDALGVLTASINKMAIALKTAFDSLQEMTDKKDDFIAIVSHELKTPITSIMATIQLLERMKFDEERHKVVPSLLARTNGQIKRLSKIVGDLLDVSKIAVDGIELHKTTFVIGDAIKEAADDVQLSKSTHQITITGDQNATITADKFRIEQVLINLISNAIKYSPRKDRVLINIKQTADQVRVELRDYGIGIPKEKQPFIFDRYYRVHNTSQNYSGLGMGLFISSEIIKKHQGQIGFESIEGEGSTFWFSLPK